MTKTIDSKSELIPLGDMLPELVRSGGKPVQQAWTDFFDGKLANGHTRRAYETAVRQFLEWCSKHRLELNEVMAGDVGVYLRDHAGSLGTKKLHLSALRRFFNLLVERHICLINPARVAETERYQVVEGKTPEIKAKQIRKLLDSIDTTTLVGKRDRAIISILIYTASRAGAVAKLRLGDIRGEPGSRKFRFQEKGGKSREIPVRHDLEQILFEYIDAAGLTGPSKDSPLFRAAIRRENRLSNRRLADNDVCRMVKRRILACGLPEDLSAHSFRVATITNLLSQEIPIESVQQLTGHADARTTKLYDRSNRKITRNLVERINL